MKYQDIALHDIVAGFKVIAITPVEEINCVVYQFEHVVTGARCLHLSTEDSNNLFSIAFRTPVSDNTGVPHILEHSVLAGSKKYPLKDPFKEMLKSSMQTFLNAITYPDRTLYPVSSQVEKDFYNLVDVYCDAVFNPLLTEQTFHQEGWHFDVENPADPVSIKGIVYNEMKGVFSDFSSHVARKMLSGLLPDTTYYFESGGEPEHITDLGYEQFKEFHARFYHPSNSFIILFGDLPSEKSLGYIQEHYLKKFERREVDSHIALQPAWNAPRRMEMDAPSSPENDGTATVLLSWLWGDATNGEAGVVAEVLSRYLFNGESAPLKRALLDSGLGEDLDELCGYDNDLIQSYFIAGLNKTTPDKAEEIEKLIVKTLKKEITKGLDSELLEGALRRFEFRLREIRKGGHFPYHLRIAEGIYRSWIYGGDPLAHVAFEKHLTAVREKWQTNPAFFTDTLKTLTVDNPHRLTMIVTASSALGEELGKKTEIQSAELSKDFTQAEREAYHKVTTELLAAQQKEHTSEELACIPQLLKSDIPTKNEVTELTLGSIGGHQFFASSLFTAGITYLDLGFDLSSLTSEQLSYYPLFAEYLTRCGAGGKSAQEMAKKVNLHTGGIHCSDFLVEDYRHPETILTKTAFHGKSLDSTVPEMLALMQDMLVAPDLEDAKLLKNILLENRNDLQSSITRSGHSYAGLRGASTLLVTKALEEQIDGISQYRFLHALAKKPKYDQILAIFKEIHAVLLNQGNLYVSLTSPKYEQWINPVESLISALPRKIFSPKLTMEKLPRQAEGVGIAVSSSVNYVTQSWHLEDFGTASMAHHYLMSRLLSTGYLWDKVRVEGGAYGGMAMAGSSHPLFTMASYRDPNLLSTLDHFKGALYYITKELTQEDVDRSLCGAVGKLDIPKSPHSKSYGEVMARLSHNLPSDRQEIRDALLSCTAEDLKKRAQFLLDTFEASQVVVVANKESLATTSLTVEDL